VVKNKSPGKKAHVTDAFSHDTLERYRLIAEASGEGVLIVDGDGAIVYANQKMAGMLGHSADEMAGRPIRGLLSEHGDEILKDALDNDGKMAIGHFDIKFSRKDGSDLWTILSTTPILDKAGSYAGLMAIVKDITGRKRMEEASLLTASIVASSDDAIIGKTLDGVITSWNAGAAKIYGYAEEEMIGRSMSVLMPHDSEDELPHILGRIKRGERIEHFETQRLRKDGRLIDVSISISPIKDLDGNIFGASTIARDITERKRSEEAIQLASAYNRSLIEASLDPLVTISPDGTITDVNKATEAVTGFPRETLVGMRFSSYFTDPAKAKEGYLKVFETGSVTDYPLEIRHRDGHVVPVLYNASIYKDKTGKVIGVFAAARDITERKRAEEAARMANAYNRSLIEASLDPLVTISPDGKITDVNEATEKVTGFSRDWLVGTDFTNYFSDPFKAREGYLQAFKEGTVQDYPLEIRHGDGHMTPVLYNASVYKDETGKVIGVFAAARDITERKRAEEQARIANAYNRSLIEASLDPLVTISPDGVIMDVNEATEKVTGYSREDLIGTDFSIYFTESIKAKEGYLAAFKEGSVKDYPLQIRRRDGHVTPVIYNASVYRDEAGRVIGVFAAARDITERKRAEEAARQMNAYNRSLIEASMDPLVTIAPDGKITDVNIATETITGYSRNALIGTDFSNYFTEPVKAREGYLKAFEKGSVKDYPLEIRNKNGRLTPVNYNASVYRDEAGRVIGVFAAARDMTVQKRAEEAVRMASAYNRSLIEASLDPLVTISPDGRITDVNKATEKATGTSREMLIGADFSDYFTEPEKAKEGYLTAFKEGSVTDYPLELRHRDGHVTPVIYNASVYRNEAGRVIGVFAAARDITEQKKIEEARSRLAAIVDSSDDAIIGKTLDGTITSWNAGAAKLYGYSEDEVLGRSIGILSSPDYSDEIPGILEKIRLGEHIDHYETVRKRKDGSNIYVSLSVSPIKDSNGRLVGASTITRDITEKKRAEEAIRLASAYNRSLIEASLDPLVTISPDGVITDVNKATEKVTGFSRERLIGTDFSDYFTEPEKAKEGYLKVFKENSVTDYPLELRHRDGHVTPVIYNASVYWDEAGKVIGVFAAARDITERRRAENALREAKDQVELYVDLMGHDINNMNQVSLGFLELAHNLIEMEGKLGEDNIVLLEKAMDSLKNSSQLIDNVRKLQREKMGLYEPEVLDVGRVIEEAVRHFHGIPGRDIRITCKPPLRCRVKANSLLKDVFVNLVGNAIKHSRGPLSVDIGVSRVVDGGRTYCRIEVEDDGPGIPDELKNTLFDRLSLSTTRAKGKGFGLCLIKMLVDDYRGKFWVEDRVPGYHTKGSRFVVLLPAVDN